MRRLLRASAKVLGTPVTSIPAVARAASAVRRAIEFASASLCVVTLLLFAFSCFYTAEVGRRTTAYWPDGAVAGSGLHGLSVEGGAVTIGKWGDVAMHPPSTPWGSSSLPWWLAPPPIQTTSRWSAKVRPGDSRGIPLWFSVTDSVDSMHLHSFDRHIVVVPLWLPALLAGLLPARWLVSRSAAALRRRARPGFCRVCGYDLRATPDRCPECGHVSAGKAAA